MGLQLIFCVESNPKSQTDWIYIHETVRHYYSDINAAVRLTPIFLSGKNNYRSAKVTKSISSYIKQYKAASADNRSVVIYAVDTDNFDSDPDDIAFFGEIQRYCADNGYEFIWFCKDIEQVYIGKKVTDSKKTSEATTFKKKHKINDTIESKLKTASPKVNSSNILAVLDKWLKR